MSANMKGVFLEHHREIRRRADVAEDGANINPSTFARVENDGMDDQFVREDQQFVLFSLSQTEFAPVPVDINQPAVCIYGVFESQSDAYEHARLVTSEHPQFSLFVDRTHKWIVAPSTMQRLTDVEYIEKHVDKLLTGVQEQLAANDAEFKENIKLQRAGKCVEKTDASDENASYTDTSSPIEEPQRGDKHRISHKCKLVEHQLAAVSFVKDTAATPEFIFRVYACYETDEKMHKYVCNVGGDHVKDYDIDIVQTCKWIYPQQMDGSKAQREVYRSSELNKVMQTHKKNPQEVQRFYRDNKQWADQPESETTTQTDQGVNIAIQDSMVQT